MTSGDLGGADFVGRQPELDRLAALAERARTGDPQVVVVRGPAGIGKTTTVRRFLARLDGFLVLWANSDASETMLDHGVVGQLMRRVPRLARASVPLLSGRIPADASPLAVGAQLLDLLGALQADGSVAVVVDDAQWADLPSLLALGFVLRRMWADQVLVIVIARPADDRQTDQLLDRLARGGPNAHTIDLAGLPAQDVAQLSQALGGREVSAATAERLRAFTGGHPLYLRTLLAEVPADQLFGRPPRITVPRSLVTAVRAMLDRLPDPTRDLLDALAVLGSPGPLARLAQVADVERPTEALQPALAAGLAQWWPSEPSSPVSIVHELQRDAIYTGLPPARRSTLHARAAEIVDRESAWAHLVAAATTADPGLAAQLDAAADEQAAHGRHGVAAQYLLWAADLSATRTDYERRLLTSAVQVLFSSDLTRALRLWPKLERCAHSALRSVTLGLTTLLAEGQWAAAQRLFAEAFELSTDPATPSWVRSTAAAGLAVAYTWGGRVTEAIEAGRLALSADGLPLQLHDYTRVLVAVGVSRQAGMTAGLAELGNLPTNPNGVSLEHLESLACRGAFHTMLGHFTEAKRDLTNVIRRYRPGFFLISGTTPHCYLAAAHYQLGEWDDAVITLERALSLHGTDEQPHNQVIRRMAASFVPAGRGDWAQASDHVRAANRIAQQIGGAQDLRYAAIAEATLHQARADHPRMLAALRRVPGLPVDSATDSGMHEWWELWWRPLLVEALLGTGVLTAAGTHLAELRRRAENVPYMASAVVRLTAWYLELTGALDDALTEVSAFLGGSRPGLVPLQDALVEHEHARRLAAVGRRANALTYLRSAKAGLARLGAVPFEHRVDAELSRLGVRGQVSDELAGLTERESEVARLAGSSLTNREIAARLYVTTKTVEYHLGNVYAKLGITSRRELRERLATNGRQGTAP